MNKKQTQSQQQKPKEKEFPVVDDFYTQFLEKKKKYLTTKLEEIAELEKKEPSVLKPDQKEKINKKQETLDKIKHFDDIKSQYFEAFAKKGAVASESKDKSGESNDQLISDFVSLFCVGKAIHNFEKNSKLIEHVFNSHQMTTIQDLYNLLNNERSIHFLEESKTKLKLYSQNDELRTSVNQFITSSKLEEEKNKTEHTHELRKSSHHEKQENHQPKKNSIHTKEAEKKLQKKNLFHQSSDDEDHHHVHHDNNKQHHVTEGKKEVHSHSTQQVNHQTEETNQVPQSLLTLLPEDDGKKGDDFKKKNQYRGNGYKDGNRPYNPNYRRDGNNYQKNEGERQYRHNEQRPKEGERQHEGNPNQREGEAIQREGEQRYKDDYRRPKKHYQQGYVQSNRENQVGRPEQGQGDGNYQGKSNYQHRPRNDDGNRQHHQRKEFDNRPYAKSEAPDTQQYKQKEEKN